MQCTRAHDTIYLVCVVKCELVKVIRVSTGIWIRPQDIARSERVETVGVRAIPVSSGPRTTRKPVRRENHVLSASPTDETDDRRVDDVMEPSTKRNLYAVKRKSRSFLIGPEDGVRTQVLR